MKSATPIRTSVLAALVAAVLSRGQTTVDLRSQARNVDFSQATATKPFKSGNTLPPSCSPGEAFFKLNAALGSNLFTCAAANTWVGVSSLPGQSAGVLSSDGSSATWRSFGGDIVGQANALTLDKLQGRRINRNAPADGDTLQWNTMTNEWAPSPGVNGLIPGIGIAITGSTISVESAVIPFYSTGIGDPTGTCTPGRDLYLDTSSSELWFCKAANTWHGFSTVGHVHDSSDIVSGIEATQIVGNIPSSRITGTFPATQITGSIPASQIAGSLPASQVSGTIPATQITGSIPASQVTGVFGNAQTSGTAAATANALVLRDSSGNFSAGTITATLNGTATAAQRLQNDPADCGAGKVAIGIGQNGDLTCVALFSAGPLPVNPATGQVAVDSADLTLKWFDGSSWRPAGGGDSARKEGAYLTTSAEAALPGSRVLQPRYGVTSSTNEAGVYHLDVNPLDRLETSFREEFLGGGTASGQIGAMGWATGSVGGGSAVVSGRMSEINRPGILRLTQSGSPAAGQGSALYLAASGYNAYQGLTGAVDWELQGIVRITTSDAGFYFGLTDGAAVSTNPGDNLVNALMFRFDTGLTTPDSATFRFVSCNGTCSATDTGVPIDGNFHRFRMRSVQAGEIRISVDGGNELVVTTNVPAAAARMSPAFFSVTRSPGTKNVDIDWVAFSQRGVAR